jgi:hypothetical protein
MREELLPGEFPIPPEGIPDGLEYRKSDTQEVLARS